jgi:hypothetical protein
MAEFESEIGNLATTQAGISSRAVAASNVRRLQIAGQNRDAAVGQIDLEKRVQRREIARQLAQFQGAQAAARASRGGDGGSVGSGQAVDFAAARAAGEQAAIAEANAANKEIAVLAQTQVQLDDPMLAAIQGGIEGFSLGTQIANALISEAETTTRQSSQQLNSGPGGLPTFQNTITQILKIPGLNIEEYLQGLNIGD